MAEMAPTVVLRLGPRPSLLRLPGWVTPVRRAGTVRVRLQEWNGPAVVHRRREWAAGVQADALAGRPVPWGVTLDGPAAHVELPVEEVAHGRGVLGGDAEAGRGESDLLDEVPVFIVREGHEAVHAG